MNLLKETLKLLKANNLTENDVKWVGAGEVYTTWEDFKKHADTEYDSGYGSQKVAQDLLVVGENWWMERSEYNGAESWDFKTLPKQPIKRIELKALTVIQGEQNGLNISCGWENLEKINGGWE